MRAPGLCELFDASHSHSCGLSPGISLIAFRRRECKLLCRRSLWEELPVASESLDHPCRKRFLYLTVFFLVGYGAGALPMAKAGRVTDTKWHLDDAGAVSRGGLGQTARPRSDRANSSFHSLALFEEDANDPHFKRTQSGSLRDSPHLL